MAVMESNQQLIRTELVSEGTKAGLADSTCGEAFVSRKITVLRFPPPLNVLFWQRPGKMWFGVITVRGSVITILVSLRAKLS